MLGFINTYIFGPALPLMVFVCGLFICVRLKFFHLLKPKRILKGIIRKSPGKTSPGKAMTLALAGTLGVGNISGVAGAIALGGPGAIFWMWVSALISMLLKYSETVLAMKYRQSIKENGVSRYSGGSFMYIAAHGFKKSAFAFAFLCALTSITMGSVVQANSISVSVHSTFGIPPITLGIVFALVTFLIISGGLSKISNITLGILPMLCITYTVVCTYIIISNFSLMGDVLKTIFKNAFDLKPAGAGIMSYGFIRALRFGVARGIFSNEAGSGTSPTAHCTSDIKSSCEQGFFGILEVFIDTILLCSLSAFVILLSGIPLEGDAMLLSISAFEHFLGGAAKYFISISIVFFAFATIICWSVYGVEALRFIANTYSVRTPKLLFIYRSAYSISVLVGMLIASNFMWELSDFSVALMTIINCGFLVCFSKEVKEETILYFDKHKK